MKNYISLALAAAFLFTSCKKDNNQPDGNIKAELSIEFDNIAGDMNLHLNTGNYSNSSGESFTITELMYYISNISLTRADGSIFTVPQEDSYFLIQEDVPESRHAKIKVPEGDYTALKFIVGVDSLRSTMDLSARKGVLDPALNRGMYWEWNSGYIFFKMEGTSTAAPNDNKFRYHIGFFGGYSSPTLNNIRTVNIDLTEGGIAKVRSGRTANIHLMVDVSKVFSGTHSFKIADQPTVMFNAFTGTVADNLPSMFSHDHTEN